MYAGVLRKQATAKTRKAKEAAQSKGFHAPKDFDSQAHDVLYEGGKDSDGHHARTTRNLDIEKRIRLAMAVRTSLDLCPNSPVSDPWYLAALRQERGDERRRGRFVYEDR